LLDLGCGAADFTAIAASAGAQPVGLDIAEAALRRARAAHPGLEFVRGGDGGSLPLPDASFDVVWASEVLEHVADTARLLSEVRRVLRTGGALLVTTPASGRLRLALSGPPDPVGDHLRLYTRRTLRRKLYEFGFEDVRVSRLTLTTLSAKARRAGWRAA
jgi:ubiquinone/menaquinone biosynthesis C-methylase UbiE